MSGSQNTQGPEKPFQFLNWRERAFYCGGLTMLLGLPVVGLFVGSTVLWDALDRQFRGRPLDGYIFQLARYLNEKISPITSRWTRHPHDGFVLNAAILLGVFVPCLFFYNVWCYQNFGFSLKMLYVYHVLRLGPYFMNFAYVYTLCHKEGHSHVGQFKGPLRPILNNIFNWWVGLFYGVMPSSFAYGHSINHHKYNNGPHDVVSTADKPRDNAKAFICYIPRFALYSINVTTVAQFWSEGNVKVALKMIFGSAFALTFMFLVYLATDLKFTLSYTLYPVLEQAVLLSCINWCWHSFMDPNDPEDEYVGSLTLLDGPINVLNEDYHVVHHQYPGSHWETNEKHFHKHFDRGDYIKPVASVFRNTHVFELFFIIILRDYKMLAEKFVDLTGKLSEEEKIDLLKQRLRTIWWGPRAPAELKHKLQGKEIGNYDLGFENRKIE